MTLSQKFFNRKQALPVEGQSLQQKRREKEEKERRKKIPKIEKPKDVGHFLVQKLKILISAHAWVTINALKDRAEKRPHVINSRRKTGDDMVKPTYKWNGGIFEKMKSVEGF